jgi:hypothetical protein
MKKHVKLPALTADTKEGVQTECRESPLLLDNAKMLDFALVASDTAVVAGLGCPADSGNCVSATGWLP